MYAHQGRLVFHWRFVKLLNGWTDAVHIQDTIRGYVAMAQQLSQLVGQDTPQKLWVFSICAVLVQYTCSLRPCGIRVDGPEGKADVDERLRW